VRVWIGILCSIPAVWGADVPRAHIREAAARAVTLLQSSQKTWYAKQSCSSCHHQFLPALAFQAARGQGIPIDETSAHADAVKAFVYTDPDRAVQYTSLIEPAMDDAFRLVSANAAGVRPNLVTAVYARLIASRQNPDGDWDGFHGRPPSSYSGFTQTALALRAIQLYSHPSQRADVHARIVRARNWLASHSPRNTEERTWQLLGLSWAEADRTNMDQAARALAGNQQPDGGWNSLDGRASDAYSTGEALVALHDAGGMPASDPVWRRGADFLLKTQAADGSWYVATRIHAPISPPYFETGYPYGHNQYISAMGACWAVMALTRALGPARPPAEPSLKEAEPSSLAPWAETVLFGTAGDLKHMLDNGLDPNSATPTGGTTALMMAAPDLEKMKLLVDRGAKVNARAKTKYSALMVTAQYRDSSAAIRWLLDRGAEVRLPPGQGAPLFNANPLFLAAYAGNADILRKLRDCGIKVDDTMVVAGTFPSTPLMGAALLGKTSVVRALLDIGAAVDRPEADTGFTALDETVIGNDIDMVRLLISRGADVNHIDNLGMTPLLWAASADFGDSAMVDLLLHSGAHAGARSKDGLTAIDLARKYKHTHLLASLGSRQ
jgi:N-acyl-D-amino-acid deacylase